jgi:hypothetical protein
MDKRKVKSLILESANNILDEETVEKLVVLNEEFINEKVKEYKEEVETLKEEIEKNEQHFTAELKEAAEKVIELETALIEAQEELEDSEDEDGEEENEEELKEAVERIIELEIALMEKEESDDEEEAEDEDYDEEEDDESDDDEEEDEDEDDEDEDDEDEDEDDEKEELKEEIELLKHELAYVKKMGVLVEMLNDDTTLSDNQKDIVVANATKLEMETLTQFEDEVRAIIKDIKTKGKLYESYKKDSFNGDLLLEESKVVKVAPLMKESKGTTNVPFIDYSGLI